MDFPNCYCLRTLILLSLLYLHARAEGTGSIFFLDSPSNQFLRTRSSDAVAEFDSMLLPEVGAAISVLLGFAPSATLSAASSSKLNKVLVPNPFNRPRAVFMLEVKGAEGSELAVDPVLSHRTLKLKVKTLPGSNKAEIQLPDEEEVSLVSLTEPLSLDSDMDSTDKGLKDFASWFGGSYTANALKPLSGELNIPLANGVDLKLHMSKEADRKFTESLMSLIHNIKSAIKMHEDLSQSIQHPAELMTGCFEGIKALQKQYGSEGVAELGTELFFTAMSKIFDSLQAAHKGQLVGVIFLNEKPSSESEATFNVMSASRSSSRWLVETTGSSNSTIAPEVVFVRRTVAWVTGVVLIIATLLGVYFLLNMPLTRDTLLYSNVKLD
ncbi:uncharacterized protein LOC131150667 [Malania oleifera]|uniref:uncharacterized protein LOC131150667 n=1 Tax=Malania oleifera TaxID=397392 RepID=UPI0025AE7B38|nr:uncharacterized protein LOC131150667 [Malania oleifera]XP_057957507.1 uncharacterized protein LOC131150667 [Malania oleifera]